MYTTVFDVREQAFEMKHLLPLMFVLVGIGIVWYARRYEVPPKRRSRTLFGCLFTGIGLIVSLVMIPGYLSARSEYRHRMDVGQFDVVEGVIENFHPMPREGHQMESFTVNGVYFEYSDYKLMVGFNNTASHGGPIKRNGQEVRLSYIWVKGENRILKIELK
jgi:hypothetical protein